MFDPVKENAVQSTNLTLLKVALTASNPQIQIEDSRQTPSTQYPLCSTIMIDTSAVPLGSSLDYGIVMPDASSLQSLINVLIFVTNVNTPPVKIYSYKKTETITEIKPSTSYLAKDSPITKDKAIDLKGNDIPAGTNRDLTLTPSAAITADFTINYKDASGGARTTTLSFANSSTALTTAVGNIASVTSITPSATIDGKTISVSYTGASNIQPAGILLLQTDNSTETGKWSTVPLGSKNPDPDLFAGFGLKGSAGKLNVALEPVIVNSGTTYNQKQSDIGKLTVFNVDGPLTYNSLPCSSFLSGACSTFFNIGKGNIAIKSQNVNDICNEKLFNTGKFILYTDDQLTLVANDVASTPRKFYAFGTALFSSVTGPSFTSPGHVSTWADTSGESLGSGFFMPSPGPGDNGKFLSIKDSKYSLESLSLTPPVNVSFTSTTPTLTVENKGVGSTIKADSLDGTLPTILVKNSSSGPAIKAENNGSRGAIIVTSQTATNSEGTITATNTSTSTIGNALYVLNSGKGTAAIIESKDSGSAIITSSAGADSTVKVTSSGTGSALYVESAYSESTTTSPALYVTSYSTNPSKGIIHVEAKSTANAAPALYATSSSTNSNKGVIHADCSSTANAAPAIYATSKSENSSKGVIYAENSSETTNAAPAIYATSKGQNKEKGVIHVVSNSSSYTDAPPSIYATSTCSNTDKGVIHSVSALRGYATSPALYALSYSESTPRGAVHAVNSAEDTSRASPAISAVSTTERYGTITAHNASYSYLAAPAIYATSDSVNPNYGVIHAEAKWTAAPAISATSTTENTGYGTLYVRNTSSAYSAAPAIYAGTYRPGNVAIKTDGKISSNGFALVASQKLKDILCESYEAQNEAWSLFQKIPFFKYKYKDEQHGGKHIYGVVAEPLHDVMPEAVSMGSFSIVPNILSECKAKKSKKIEQREEKNRRAKYVYDLTFPEDFGKELSQITLDKIRLRFKKEGKDNEEHTSAIILSVSKNAIIIESSEELPETVFAYGTQEECPTVDKNMVFELGMVALQHAMKRIEILEAQLLKKEEK